MSLGARGRRWRLAPPPTSRRGRAARHACAIRPVAPRLLLAAGLGERISLFGSLAWGEPGDRSDVDLLIWGLPAARWDDASRVVEDLVEAPVDLVRAEDAAPQLLLRVERFGVALT
ncbi:MAG: nucleotidyltransferase domain-containing protein [Deltaproteobacteria bacterium]|nr:nucleotidyltransferase domain-containing protein [Deltaproteobacteria bacterium]